MVKFLLILSLFFIPLNFIEASPPVPNLSSPINGAQSIVLEEDSTLILKWEESSGATGYQYQYWEQGENVPETFYTAIANRSEPIQSSSLKPGVEYLWHVRSCDESGCGNYSLNWNFKFLLAPPALISPINGGVVALPAELYWENAVGAKSYSIKAKVKFDSRYLSFDEASNPIYSSGLDNFFGQLELPIQNVTCPFGLWNSSEDGWDAASQNNCSTIPINSKDETGQLETNYIDNDCLFTKDTEYKWQVASCLGENETNCGNFSSEASFRTADNYVIPPPALVHPLYDLEKPEEIPIAGFNDSLEWRQSDCSHYQKVTITREEDGQNISVLEIGSLNLNNDAVKDFLWNYVNYIYTWKVESCYATNNGIINCDPQESEVWKFRTLRTTPENLQAFINGNVKLTWERGNGGESYIYQLSENADFNEARQFTATAKETKLEYPDIMPDKRYWWRVATCIDNQGNYCGNWSDSAEFYIPPLGSPTGSNQTGELPFKISWDSGQSANYYQYKVYYTALDPEETLEDCALGPGIKNIIPQSEEQNPPITSKQEFTLSSLCLGTYSWKARSCFDKDCTINSDPGWNRADDSWNFTAVSRNTNYGGLVPCGKQSNNPDTPYNEREPCQIKHLGFLFQNILDFLLWRLGLIVLGIYSIMSGVIAYFSLGGVNTLQRIKSIWKSAGIGYLILLLSWTLVNLVMSLAGFQAQFFGRWWQLPF